MTLVGTPPNAILAKELPGMTFASWMGIGVPFAALALPAAWLVVSRALPMPARFEHPYQPPERRAWTFPELAVTAVVVGAMALWLTRRPVDLGVVKLPGWSQLLADPAMVNDAWVAMGAAFLIFLIPGGAHTGTRFVLPWGEAQRRLPWSVLLLLGGGFSLALGIEASGLTLWLAGATDGLQWLTASDGPFAATPWLGAGLAVLAICAAMTLLTELTSNTATTQIVLPVLAAGAAGAGVEPALWMVPATISASCAFTMPVATAPNAIASEAGGVSPGDMAFAGSLLNAVCVVIAAGVAWLLV
jgi:sodium-dependent dicarboxylate transporter 2/3/5